MPACNYCDKTGICICSGVKCEPSDVCETLKTAFAAGVQEGIRRFKDIIRIDFDLVYGSEDDAEKMVALFRPDVISEDEASELIDEGPFCFDNEERMIVVTQKQFENVFGKDQSDG